MTFDVKLPRWLTLCIFALWALSLVESIVCQAINARANLHYLAGNGSTPPPPYPGSAIETTPEDKPQPEEKPEPKHPFLNRRKR